MTITDVELQWAGPAFSDDFEGSVGYTEHYRVYSNNPQESANAVRSALPAIGTGYGGDPDAIVKTRTADRIEESRLVWDCTVEYNFDPSDPNAAQEIGPEADPTEEFIKFRWTSQLYTKAVIKDRLGDAIVNSAGDYFDPPPEIEDVRWQVNVQANVTAVPLAVLDFAGAINDAAFTIDGVPVNEKAGRIIAIDISELKLKNEIFYRTFTYTVEFRPSWDLELLDQGFRRSDYEGGPDGGYGQVDILIPDEDGNESRPSAPVLLDGFGQPLNNPSPDNAVFLDFEVYDQIDFSQLPGVVSN